MHNRIFSTPTLGITKHDGEDNNPEKARSSFTPTPSPSKNISTVNTVSGTPKEPERPLSPIIERDHHTYLTLNDVTVAKKRRY